MYMPNSKNSRRHPRRFTPKVTPKRQRTVEPVSHPKPYVPVNINVHEPAEVNMTVGPRHSPKKNSPSRKGHSPNKNNSRKAPSPNKKNSRKPPSPKPLTQVEFVATLDKRQREKYLRATPLQRLSYRSGNVFVER